MNTQALAHKHAYAKHAQQHAYAFLSILRHLVLATPTPPRHFVVHAHAHA